jgi:hypothetical protein
MTARRHSVFNKIKATCDELEMIEMMSLKYDWNKEIICQFYATLYFDTDGQRFLWMIYGQQCVIIVHEFAWMLGLEHQLTSEPTTQIHSFNVLKLDEMQFMYVAGVVAHTPKIQNFHLELNTLHRLVHTTLNPRIGDSIVCPQYERTLIPFYVQKKPFSNFYFLLQEIISISRTALHSCGYAPQIMMMIDRVIGREFLTDHEITDLKPQNLIVPTITMDVPSTSTAPRTTHSGSAPPPLGCSSSSSGDILRVLRSMFAWCCDTRQLQDVLLSNQRHQNEKMGIDEFDEFPLPVPPLDDDPFTSLSVADIMAMEASPDDDTDGSGSEYEEEDEDDA